MSSTCYAKAQPEDRDRYSRTLRWDEAILNPSPVGQQEASNERMKIPSQTYKEFLRRDRVATAVMNAAINAQFMARTTAATRQKSS